MAVMLAVGSGHHPPRHAHVRETGGEYVVELDVSDFTEDELAIEARGPVVTVRGDQLETKGDEGLAFRLHERLEESFRLPDDADADHIQAVYRHGSLKIHAPRLTIHCRAIPIELKPFQLFNGDATPC